MIKGQNFKPVVLIVLDGWGIAPDGPGNAVTKAKTPYFNRLWSNFPHTQLVASGEAVGLPRGEDGNSETGHLNLGAGQIVFQDLPRIDMAIADESFFQIPAFKMATDHATRNQSKLHLMGLVGGGGVHSSMDHLFALMKLASAAGLKKVYLHLFTDGRDSSPTSARAFVTQVEQVSRKLGLGKISTICGRYFAMDRDYRWERTKKAYELLVQGKGNRANSASDGINLAYQAKQTDEFIEPTLIDPEGLIEDHDAVIFFNYRIDRPRQITKAFVLPDFENVKISKAAFDPYAERYGLKVYEAPAGRATFKREKIVEDLIFVTMTEYEPGLPAQSAFPPEKVKYPLARALSERGIRQFRIAETEKERFVTYYFNGQREDVFPGEVRMEIPSPSVATYDLKPEMSAHGVTETVIKQLRLNIFDFFVINFANPDMVGHTGVLEAGSKACEVVDNCLEKLIKIVLSIDGAAVVTADHGNAEEMIDLETGEIDTKHSTNAVPLIIVGKAIVGNRVLSRGILADVAPTILGLLGIEKPTLMTGRNLLE
ncbi:2,3-bisphosphoglycerate-independent phosphoglycerate mutase [Patescibacteria group bacterium]